MRSKPRQNKPKVKQRAETALPRPDAPFRPALKLIGFLGILGPWIGILLLALKHYGPIALTPEQLSDLTRGGHFWVKMERDINIYVLGTIALLSGLFVIPWNRLRIPETSLKPNLLALGGLAWTLLPAFFWKDLPPVPAGIRPAIVESLLVVSLACMHSILAIRSLWRPVESTESETPNRMHFGPLPRLNLLDMGYFLGIFLLLFIPSPGVLSGRFFQIEDFAHWNGFVMTWALAFKHGAAIYRDVIPIYGGGWPVLFGWAAQFRELNYSDCISVCVLFSILYYCLFYYLLRYITGNRLVSAAICILAVVGLTFLSGEPETKSIVWRWPSGTPMRSPVDLLFFIALISFCNSPTRLAAALIGITAGLAPIFAIDTGTFLLATFLTTGVLIVILPEGKPWRRYLGIAAISLLLTLLLGFALETRGKIFDPQTLSNLYAYRNRVSSGLGLIPIAELDGFWVGLFALSLLVMFGTGLVALARPRSSQLIENSIYWASAIYGIQRMIYFLGRTTPGTLPVAIIPSLMCLALLLRPYLLKEASNALSTGASSTIKPSRPLSTTLTVICLGTAVLILAISKDIPNYPALWNMKGVGQETGPLSIQVEGRKIEGLPAAYKDYAQAIQQVCGRIKTLHQEGLRVQVLDACSTTIYTLADIPPFGKDVNEFDRADTSLNEIRLLKERISNEGADIIVLNRLQAPWPRVFTQEALLASRDEMFKHYRLTEQFACFELWKRQK